MVTLIPASLMAWVARTASAISVPATKRPETRRPSEDRSAKLRKDGFSERRTKKALNIPHLEIISRDRLVDEDEEHRTLYHTEWHAAARAASTTVGAQRGLGQEVSRLRIESQFN